MATQRSAQILVDTFREGALALLGHDLRIEAPRFELSVASGVLTGHVALGALRVLGSVRKGKLDESSPSPTERAEIEQRMRDEILVVARNPSADITGVLQRDGARSSLSGTLQLCGRSQPVRASVEPIGDWLETSITLVPSAYGIAPFRALGGALRIADRVVIHVRLPLPTHAELAALTARWQRPTQ
jgi:hypothetical protein